MTTAGGSWHRGQGLLRALATWTAFFASFLDHSGSLGALRVRGPEGLLSDRPWKVRAAHQGPKAGWWPDMVAALG